MKEITLFVLLCCCAFSFAQEKNPLPEIVPMEAPEDQQEAQDIPFAIIEDVPIYPNCIGTKQQKKDCLNKSIQNHVIENFNIKKMGLLELSPGKKKIYVQFRIDRKGEINQVVARGPHEEAEREGIRVVKLLPKMIPGKQRGRNVNVRYMLPISFNIE